MFTVAKNSFRCVSWVLTLRWWSTNYSFHGGGLFWLLSCLCSSEVFLYVNGVLVFVFPVSLLSHARLRCMCTCNRCTFCLCQNFLNSELLQTVRAKLYAVVLRRFFFLFLFYLSTSLSTSDYLSDLSPSSPQACPIYFFFHFFVANVCFIS